MPGFIAVLDACVLYPASLRDTLLRAAMRDFYRPQWSAHILDEVTRNLRDNRGLTEEQAIRLFNALRRHFREAEISDYESLIPQLTCQEKDRHVLAAAIQAHADVIVTFNLKDFPSAALTPYNIEALHPDTFLTHLFDLSPDGMATILREQATALKNPATSFERMLEALGQYAPAFASAVRQYLQEEKPADMTDTPIPS